MKKKVDCLFLHVPILIDFSSSKYYWSSFTNMVAIGLYSMCNELAKNKISAQIINLGLEKFLDINYSITKYVKKQQIKIIGLSLHWHYQTYDTLTVAKKIKEENPDV